jgi:hypothetical protein
MPPTVSDATLVHPLRPLSSDEISTARQILTDAGLLPTTSRVVYLGLEEPGKDMLHGPNPVSADRVVRALLHDVAHAVLSRRATASSRTAIGREWYGGPSSALPMARSAPSYRRLGRSARGVGRRGPCCRWGWAGR